MTERQMMTKVELLGETVQAWAAPRATDQTNEAWCHEGGM